MISALQLTLIVASHVLDLHFKLLVLQLHRLRGIVVTWLLILLLVFHGLFQVLESLFQQLVRCDHLRVLLLQRLDLFLQVRNLATLPRVS